MNKEIWLPVVGWEQLYEVSSFGRIRSFSHIRKCRNGKPTLRPGSILVGSLVGRKKTHYKIILKRKPRQQQEYVHRLVLLAFVGPCPIGMEACHYPDRDTANNNLNNLRWDTKKANHADAVKHGTRR